MIGVIVTGHGGFAAGMESNVKMLAGTEAELIPVAFTDGMALEELDEKLAAALDRCQDCACTIVLTDVVGGTPFNHAATLSVNRPNVRVISGANSGMLMDLCMRNITGDQVDDINALADELMETAHEGITKFVLEPVEQDGGEDEEDGI